MLHFTGKHSHFLYFACGNVLKIIKYIQCQIWIFHYSLSKKKKIFAAFHTGTHSIFLYTAGGNVLKIIKYAMLCQTGISSNSLWKIHLLPDGKINSVGYLNNFLMTLGKKKNQYMILKILHRQILNNLFRPSRKKIYFCDIYACGNTDSNSPAA